MIHTYGEYTKSVADGTAAEERFMKAFVKTFPDSEVKASTVFDNKNRHIDVICKRGNSTVTFDVKAEKKVNRSDSTASTEYTWVELLTNFGRPGWAYGKEKYLAFEWGNEFIIVEREKMLNMVNDRKLPEIKTENKDLPAYSQYQRAKYGNKDVCVLTPIADLREISKFILKK
jgi:hypothetical protein